MTTTVTTYQVECPLCGAEQTAFLTNEEKPLFDMFLTYAAGLATIAHFPSCPHYNKPIRQQAQRLQAPLF